MSMMSMMSTSQLCTRYQTNEEIKKLPLKQQCIIYRQALSHKWNDLRNQLGLPEDMDISDDCSLELLKKLSEDTGWIRSGYQKVVGWFPYYGKEVSQTNFQYLVTNVENLYKKIDNTFLDNKNKLLEALSKENPKEAGSFERVAKPLTKLLDDYKIIAQSLPQETQALKQAILDWRAKKDVTSDIDMLKVIALTNLYYRIENITNIKLDTQNQEINAIIDNSSKIEELQIKSILKSYFPS